MANKKVSKRAIPGYTLIPQGDHFKIKKIGITRERVKNDPAFHNTRRLNKEFAHVQQVVTLIRTAFLGKTNIRMSNGPLTKILHKALSQDDQNILGRRNLANAPLPGLLGFNFNPQYHFNKIFPAPITARLDPKHAQLKVQIPAFNAGKDVLAPEGATHYRIRITVASFNMQELTHAKQEWHTQYLPLKAITIKGREHTFLVNDWQFQLHMAAVHIEWFTAFKGIAMITDKKFPQSCCIMQAWQAFNKLLVRPSEPE